MANRIFLIRHGENPANLTKEFSSRIVNYSLTAKGRLQAHQTAAWFLDKEIQVVCTSPLKRAYETAKIIAYKLDVPIETLDHFREIEVGDLGYISVNPLRN
jgi:broad specificity phosphatase PhoE